MDRTQKFMYGIPTKLMCCSYYLNKKAYRTCLSYVCLCIILIISNFASVGVILSYAKAIVECS